MAVISRENGVSVLRGELSPVDDSWAGSCDANSLPSNWQHQIGQGFGYWILCLSHLGLDLFLAGEHRPCGAF